MHSERIEYRDSTLDLAGFQCAFAYPSFALRCYFHPTSSTAAQQKTFSVAGQGGQR